MSSFCTAFPVSLKSIALALTVGGVLAANSAVANPGPLRAKGYQLYDLGTLGGTTSDAVAVDAIGTVVGEALNSLDQARAFMWCAGCGMHSLGTLQNGTWSYATDISANGEWIVGNSGIRPALNPEQFVDIGQGFVWTDTGIESIGEFSNPATPTRRFGSSEAHGVNDHGQVVGFAVVQRQNLHSAFLWQNGVLLDIGQANSDGSNSRAFDINNAGHVVGDITLAGVGSNGSEAFLWRDGIFTYLPHAPGANSSTATAINSRGLVAGWSVDADGDVAVLWSANKLRALGTLGNDSNSRALGLNDLGQVVGWSGEAGDSRAFIWQAGNMLDLNALLPRRSGWTLLEASDINNDGTIVGTGLKQGQLRAFMLKPPSLAAAVNRVLNTVQAKVDKAAARPKKTVNDLIKAIQSSSSLGELLAALR